MSRKRKPSVVLVGDPTVQRRQHSLFAKDVLTPPGAPVVARYRVRPLLTPLEARRQILEETAGKPEEVRLRSLRRRLTLLDRALDDRQVELLHRLTECINTLSHIRCVDLVKSEVRTVETNRLPFSDWKRLELELLSFVIAALGYHDRDLLFKLAQQLDITVSKHRSIIEITPETIQDVVNLCEKLQNIYASWKKTKFSKSDRESKTKKLCN